MFLFILWTARHGCELTRNFPRCSAQLGFVLGFFLILGSSEPSTLQVCVGCGDMRNMTCSEPCFELASTMVQSFAHRTVLRSDKATTLPSSAPQTFNPTILAEDTASGAAEHAVVENRSVLVSPGFSVSGSQASSVSSIPGLSSPAIPSTHYVTMGLCLLASAAAVSLVAACVVKSASKRVEGLWQTLHSEGRLGFEAVQLARTSAFEKRGGSADVSSSKKSSASETWVAMPASTLPKLELDLLGDCTSPSDVCKGAAVCAGITEAPRPGDLLILGSFAPPRLEGRAAIAIQSDRDHCTVVVLDDHRRQALGEWQARLTDISHVESTAWRLGARIIVRGMPAGSRGRELNGRVGTITIHPREGYPCFLKQEWSRQPLGQRRLAFCVRFHNPPEDGQSCVVIDAQYIFVDDGGG